MLIARIKTWWRAWRNPPVIYVSLWAYATPNPRVNVGLHSTRGMMTVLDFPATEQGHAAATDCARSLAHITGFRIVYRRRVEDFWVW